MIGNFIIFSKSRGEGQRLLMRRPSVGRFNCSRVVVLGATMVTVAMAETLAKMALPEPGAVVAGQVVTEAIQMANLEVAAAVLVFTECIIQMETM